jgi:hypothetical protein
LSTPPREQFVRLTAFVISFSENGALRKITRQLVLRFIRKYVSLVCTSAKEYSRLCHGTTREERGLERFATSDEDVSFEFI